jgi:putative transposase
MYAGSRAKINDNFIQLNKSLNSSYTKEDHKIKFKKHSCNHTLGDITGFNISKDNLDNYYIAITHKIDITKFKQKGKSIGIDLGIKELITTSDNLVVPNHNYTKKNTRKLKLEQRKHTRKKKGSLNRNKARLKVAKVHKKIKNSRSDYNHKVSSFLSKHYSFIGMETLKVKNMLENRRLTKAISNVAFYQLTSFIEYKCNENQVKFVKINQWYPSSKTCSKCSNIKMDLELSDRVYSCNKCGMNKDRDLNASINILKESKRIYKYKKARKE